MNNQKQKPVVQKTEELTELESLQIQVIDLKIQALNRDSQELQKTKNEIFKLIAQRLGVETDDIQTVNYANKTIYLKG